MIIMSIDLGKVRTGIAVCDKNEILAFPLCTITEKDENILLEKIFQKALEVKAEKIIIGLPKNMDGTLGESAKRALKFGESLKSKINIPIEFWDERQTTVIAHNYLNETNIRGKKRKSIIDSLSASIILEDYLKYIKKDRK
ncbi:MAG: Holliday junction resolvase RuvX [Clostridia bacterium]|nr:Holliday junction resolvase RuvX [Clostridia bacterium]